LITEAQFDTLHAIAYDNSQFRVENSLQTPSPLQLLKSALETFEHDQMESKDEIIYGNRGGIPLLKSLDTMKDRVSCLEANQTAMNEKLECDGLILA
jgi:hypothetical protein